MWGESRISWEGTYNMNKVFKVVWSATKNAYVVTSELAKSHQKTATTVVAAI